MQKMIRPYRLVQLMLALQCLGNLGVFGQSSSTDPTNSDPSPPSVSPSLAPPPPPTPPPDTALPPISSTIPPAQPPIIFFPTPTNLPSYPPTPVLTTPAASPLPSTALTTIQATTIPMPRTTPPNSIQQPNPASTSNTAVPVAPASQTTLPQTNIEGVQYPSSQVLTLAGTTIPVPSAPSSEPQRAQVTFANMFNDIQVTKYDLWTQQSDAVKQLADACNVSPVRITDIDITSNPAGYLVLRFSIQQGWPVYITDAVQNLKASLNTTTPQLKLAGQQLTSPVAIYWTDSGPCPNSSCLNNGTCDVTLSGDYTCSCDVTHTGPRCQDDVKPIRAAADNRLLALLVLLIIPIAVAVIIGFYFGIRRQQKEQLKKAFDLKDVRTIGPKSMLSLPMESGIRNDMYDTRSYALAFTDTTFSKGSSTPPASSTNDDSASSGAGLF